MAQFTETQPKDGEHVVHCGHLDAEVHHFFRMGGDGIIHFKRPDGTQGEATWMVVCEACYKRAAGQATLVQIRGDAVWEGDEPIVTEDPVRNPEVN